MYGYIYLTINTINQRMYIGKRQSEQYDQTYYGSGKVIKQAITKYGKENFKNIILDTADSLQELNQKEKYYIQLYHNAYGSLMYNIASGGDDGNTLLHKTPQEKQEFVDKMTKINAERARKSEYRKNIGHKIKLYYDNHPDKRNEHAEKIKASWTPSKRRAHGELIKARPPEVKKQAALSHQKKCIFELNGNHKEFAAVKDLMEFLINEHQYHPDRRTFNRILADGANGIPYNSFHQKNSRLNGMIIYRVKDREDVSTKGDECSPVEREISARPKSEAKHIMLGTDSQSNGGCKPHS